MSQHKGQGADQTELVSTDDPAAQPTIADLLHQKRRSPSKLKPVPSQHVQSALHGPEGQKQHCSKLRWTAKETQELIKGVQLFGPNVEWLCKLFPDRTRRQVAVTQTLKQGRFKKLNREGKLDLPPKKKRPNLSRYLLVKQASITKMESVLSTTSQDSTQKRLYQRTRQLLSTPSVEQAERKLLARQTQKKLSEQAAQKEQKQQP